MKVKIKLFEQNSRKKSFLYVDANFYYLWTHVYNTEYNHIMYQYMYYYNFMHYISLKCDSIFQI